jgi:hypothetical protein
MYIDYKKGILVDEWSLQDVIECTGCPAYSFPDLTDDQALQVLERALKNVDPEFGINFEYIQECCENLFGSYEERAKANV